MNKFLLTVVFLTCMASISAGKKVIRIPLSELSPEELQAIKNSPGFKIYGDDYDAGVRKKSPYMNSELSRQLSLDAVARNSEYEGIKDESADYIQRAKLAYEVKQKNIRDGLYDMDEDLNRASNPYDLYDLLDKIQVKYVSSRSDLQKKLEKDGLTPDEQKTKLAELEKSYDGQKSVVEKKLKEIVEETAQGMNVNSAELLQSYKKGYESLYKPTTKSENKIEFNAKLMSATSVIKKITLLDELKKNFVKNMSALEENLKKANESGDNDSVKNINEQKQKLENEYNSQKRVVKKKLIEQAKPSYDQYGYDYDTRVKNNYNSYDDTRYQPYQRPYSAYDEDAYYHDQYNRQPSRRYSNYY